MPTDELDTAARLKSLRQHGSQEPGRTTDSRSTTVSMLRNCAHVFSWQFGAMASLLKRANLKRTEHRTEGIKVLTSRSTRAQWTATLLVHSWLH